MSKALELAKFGRETPPTGVVVGDSDAQTLSSKTFSDMPVFSSGTTNTVAYLNASKVLSSSTSLSFDGSNLGIGVASPAATLDVYGGVNGRLQIYSSASGNFLTSKVAANTGYQILNYLGSQHVWGDGTTTRMVVDASGNVGINKSTGLAAKLDVVGTTNISGKLTVSTFGSRVRNLEVYGSDVLFDAGDGAFDMLIGDGGFAYMSLTTTDNATALKIRNHTGNADIATFERVSGNVGIGTSSPSGKFHVSQASGSMYISVAGGVPRMNIGGGNGWGFNRITTSEDIFFGEPGDTGTWRVRGAGTISLGVGSTATTMTIAGNGGNVGIGITNPAATLHVNATGGGTIRASRSSVGGEYIQMDHDGTDGTIRASGNNRLNLVTNGANRIIITGGGSVGVGGALPLEILSVIHSNYESFGLYRNLDYNSVGAMGTRMFFGGYVGSTATRSAAIDGTLMTATTGRLSFSTLISGTLTEAMRIDTNGSVRMGGAFAAQVSTNEKLTVDGGTSQAATLSNSSDSSGTLYLKNRSATAATIQPYIYFNDADGGNRGGFGVKYTDASVHQFAQGGINWYIGSAGFSGRAATLTSTGLLINSTGGNSGVASAPIHVSANGLSNTYGTLRLEGANRGGILEMYNAVYPVSKIITDQSGNLTIQTSASFATSTLYDRMLIDTNGKVLIGLSSAPNTNATTWNLYSTGMITGGSGYTYGVYGGSSGNLTLTANAYPANTGSTHYVSIASGSSGGGGPEEIARFTNQGRVGIGTTAPNEKLTVWTTSATGLQTALRLNNPFGFANQNTGTQIVFSQDRSTAEDLKQGIIAVGQQDAGTSATSYMSFYTNNTGLTERMRITSTGLVGIGTNNPEGKLEVKTSGDGPIFIGRFHAGAAKLVYAYQSGSDGFLELRTGADVTVTKLSGYAGTTSYFTSPVAVGHTSAAAKLHVGGTGASIALESFKPTEGFARSVEVCHGVSGSYNTLTIEVNLSGAGGWCYELNSGGTGNGYTAIGGGYVNGPGNFSHNARVAGGNGSLVVSCPTDNVIRFVHTGGVIHPVCTFKITGSLGQNFSHSNISVVYS